MSAKAEAAAQAFLASVGRHAGLNAVAAWDAGTMMRDAASVDGGPLDGMAILIKDNVNTADYPTTAATPALAANRPATDAPIVQRLKAAGALIAGKANMHELSSGGTNGASLFGPARNPYDPACVPGGSSGGVAAAVAAGIVRAGIGTDTMGSIRVPAALCGVIGFRPSVGRYPAEGIVPLSSSQDTPGPMARTMEDIIALDAVLAGDEAHYPRPQQIRIGVAQDLIAASSADVQGAIRKALAALEEQGVVLVPLDIEPMRALHRAATNTVSDTEFAGMMRAYLTAYAPYMTLEDLVAQIASPAIKSFTEARLAKAPDAHAYAEAIGPARAALDAAWAEMFAAKGIDALAFPTTPETALPLHEDDMVLRNGEPAFSWFYYGHSALGTAGRRPCISLPAGLAANGLPIGLELDGLPGRDRDMLGQAAAIFPLLPPTPAPA
jgi:indoleacetamide hydrolase